MHLTQIKTFLPAVAFEQAKLSDDFTQCCMQSFCLLTQKTLLQEI